MRTDRVFASMKTTGASLAFFLLSVAISANVNDDLLKAASQGSVTAIQSALKKGARIGVTDQFGRTALHMAAAKGSLEAIEALLANKAPLGAKDSWGLTPLLRAAASLQGPAVKLLLERGADRQSLSVYLAAKDSSGRTLLHMAARDGSPASLAVFCQIAPRVDQLDNLDRSPLSLAVSGAGVEAGNRRRDYLEAVRILLGAGADPLLSDEKGNSPLWYAVHQDDGELVSLLSISGVDIPALTEAYDRGDIQIARLLTDRIADPGATDANGRTFLHVAAQQGLPDLAAAVLSRGVEVDAVDRFGRTPLSLAAVRSDLTVAQMLLDAGADPNRPAEMGATPLNLAARQGQIAIADLLIERGAEMNASGKTTPLIEAVLARNLEMTGFLLSRGAEIDLRDGQGNAPLFYCVEARTGISGLEVLKLLLQQGPTVDVKNAGGETALLHAVEGGKRDEASALFERGADPNAADLRGRTALSAAKAGKDAVIVGLLSDGPR
jgi:ankyrin repeat protein